MDKRSTNNGGNIKKTTKNAGWMSGSKIIEIYVQHLLFLNKFGFPISVIGYSPQEGSGRE